MFIKIKVYNNTWTMEVHPEDAIIMIKYKLLEKFVGNVADIVLIFAGKELQNSKTLESYNILRGSTLTMVAKTKCYNNINITINNLNISDSININALSSDTIIILKDKIYKSKFGIEPQNQILTFNEQILEDSFTLKQYNLKDNSIINLTKHFSNINPSEVKLIQISIHNSLNINDCLILQVDKNYTIKRVKSMIRENRIIPEEIQTLTLNGKELKNYSNLIECDIEEKSIITLNSNHCYLITVLHDLPNLDVIKLAVYKENTLKHIKELIKIRMPLNYDYILIYNHKEMLESYKLQDMIIDQNNITMYLIPKNASLFYISIKTLSQGEVLKTRVHSRVILKELKTFFKKHTGIFPEHYSFMFNGFTLIDENRDLTFYNIHENSNLTIQMRTEKFLITAKFNEDIYNLHVQSTNTIEDIKNKIKDILSIPIIDQILIFNSNSQLQNSKLLSEYGIKLNSAIEIRTYNSYIKIAIEMPNNSILKLYAKQTENFRNIKERLETQIQIPHNKQMLCLNKYQQLFILNDTTTLLNSNLERNDVIKLIPLIIINIKHIENSCVVSQHYIHVGLNDTIRSVKEQIYNMCGLQTENQILKYCHRLLIDINTISNYNINDNDEIILENKQVEFYSILIMLPNGKILGIDVNAKNSINSLKYQIEMMENIPITKQCLAFNGEEMNDGNFIGDYKIQNQSLICVNLKKETKFGIAIDLMQEGRIIMLEIASTDSIELLKSKIEEKTKFPVWNQKLIMNNQKLKDDFTVGKYQITPESVLILIEKHRINNY